MSRPRLRVIQGGAADPPRAKGRAAGRPTAAPQRREPGAEPRSRRFAAAQAEATRRPPARRRRPATRRRPPPAAMTWLFAGVAMGGVVVAWAGPALIGLSMALAGAAAMISPPTAPVAGRARTISLALIVAATLLAATDIGVSLLG